MQGMSGIEPSEKLARINTAVKLFLMTAYEIDSDMQEATGNIRVDEVFKKPVPPEGDAIHHSKARERRAADAMSLEAFFSGAKTLRLNASDRCLHQAG